MDLSQADLIRNFILMRLPEKEQTRLYTTYWSKIEDLFRGLEARLLERSGYREVDFYEGQHRMFLGVLWALLIVLITCEWLLRKRWQLH